MIDKLDKIVAFLGPEASFSSIATTEIFGDSIKRLPLQTIHDVFISVENDESDYGVVPIENSTEGSVAATLDELINTNLNITAEREIRISLNLMSESGELNKIKKLYSHPHAIGQCREWISANIPHVEIINVTSTTVAASYASNDKEAAAVASAVASSTYHLKIAAENIEDIQENYTRFFVMGKTQSIPSGNDKTSIVCSVKDKPAALLSLLKPFADYAINMKKIESRPVRKKMWDYNFFIDFLGHRDEEIVKEALIKMNEEAVFFKILGSYAVGVSNT